MGRSSGSGGGVLLSAEGETAEAKINVLVYGPPGSGKTTLGVTAPDPVILLSERQGFGSIVQAAKRTQKPVPPTFWVQNVGQLRAALRALRTPEPMTALVKALVPEAEQKRALDSMQFGKPQTVVLDSVTELFALIGDELDEMSPPKPGKDGLPARGMNFWSVLLDRSVGFIRSMRDLEAHVLYLALVEDKEIGEEDEKSRIYQPATPMRKLPGVLAAACNAVGVAQVRQVPQKDGDAKLVHSVRFAGPSWMMTKPMRPLHDLEEPDMTQWLATLAAGTKEE